MFVLRRQPRSAKPSAPHGVMMREMAEIQARLDSIGHGTAVFAPGETRQLIEHQLAELKRRCFGAPPG
jgi:hypothetical protein